MRNVSIEQFRTFIRVSDEWEGLPLADSLYRLYLLADFFAEQTGIRLVTYITEAWKIRFHENTWKLSESAFRRAVLHIGKESRNIWIPGETIYDQFLTTASGAKIVREPVVRTKPKQSVPKPASANNTLDAFFSSPFGDHLKNFSLER